MMATLYDLDEVTMKVRAQGITLATLCDLVLGEDATNRSDEALIQAVGELKREHQEMKTAVNWDVLREMQKGWQIKYLPQENTGGNDGKH